MSIRIIESSEPKTEAARAFANSVFPTPVGPKNINDPIGRCGSANPLRDRRIAFAIELIASF